MQTIPYTGINPLKFPDAPDFKPFYTPKDILELGSFGGSFFFSATSRSIPELAKITRDVDPAKIYRAQPDADTNYFGVLVVMRNRDMPMILKGLHPLGWFEWYCRYYLGERSPADNARINQWATNIKDVFHYIKYGTYTGEGNRLTDLEAFKTERQLLLQFGWDPTKDPDNYNIG